MSKFHVTCVYDEKKKILTLKDKREYKEKIRALFSLPSGGKYRIQQYNENYEEWFDIEKWEDLADGGKLKIIVSSG